MTSLKRGLMSYYFYVTNNEHRSPLMWGGGEVRLREKETEESVQLGFRGEELSVLG